jgi:hypothetical protein
MQALQALIFDVDGTLADTERDGHRPAFNRAFQEAGLDWDWTVPLYGELLAVTGGKERILHYLRHWQPDFLERPDLADFIAEPPPAQDGPLSGPAAFRRHPSAAGRPAPAGRGPGGRHPTRRGHHHNP